MHGRELIQAINFMLYAGTLYLLLLLVRRGILSFMAMIAPASFFLHAIIFYGVVLMADISDITSPMTDWSAALRLHGGIISLAIVVALLHAYRRDNVR